MDMMWVFGESEHFFRIFNFLLSVLLVMHDEDDQNKWNTKYSTYLQSIPLNQNKILNNYVGKIYT
jgi:hypothetical protein